MPKICISTAARSQVDVAKIPEFPPPLLPAHDLQARKLGQRFALTTEVARTIADFAFNAGVRA
jgi:hypothetical protein